jgi:hypothetical protein
MVMPVSARSALRWLPVLLVPTTARAHDFDSLKTAFIPFMVLHILGMIPWLRSWSILIKVAYLLLFPLVLIAGTWVVYTFIVPAPVAIAIWCSPTLLSFAAWGYWRLLAAHVKR